MSKIIVLIKSSHYQYHKRWVVNNNIFSLTRINIIWSSFSPVNIWSWATRYIHFQLNNSTFSSTNSIFLHLKWTMRLKFHYLWPFCYSFYYIDTLVLEYIWYDNRNEMTSPFDISKIKRNNSFFLNFNGKILKQITSKKRQSKYFGS